MMAARLLLTIALLFLSLPTYGQGVYVKAGTIGRYDRYGTNRQRTRTPESIYTNAVLQMPFSYDDGSPYYDCSKSNNDGTQATAGFRPLWTNGWGGAYNFDGADDYIATAYVPSGLSALTYSIWAKADSFAVGTFAGVMGNLNDPIIRRTTAGGGKIQFWDGGAAAIVSDAAFPTATWVHIVVTIDASNLQTMYVNGVAQADTLTQSTWTAATEVIVFGWSATAGATQYFDGAIDDPRVYDRNLSPTEITALYNATTGVH